MNFQPLSADFYFSEPILILEGLLVLSKDYSNFEVLYFNPDNTTVEQIPIKFQHINQLNHLEEKSFGKDRGVTKRNEIRESRLFGIFEDSPSAHN